MKRGLALALLSFLLGINAFAQILTPVKWSWKAEPTAKPGEYKLIFKAKIDNRAV